MEQGNPPTAVGSNAGLGVNVAEARNATVLGLNDVDKQKLDEARQLAHSMISHPVAFGTIEHTEKAGELLGELVKANESLAREAYTWSKAAETYAKQARRTPLDPLDVEELWDTANADDAADEVHHAFARLLERAHGIGA